VINSGVDWERAGRFVRAARGRRYPTVDAFAEACGVGKTTIADLELGRRSNFQGHDAFACRGRTGLAGWTDRCPGWRRGVSRWDLDPDLRLLADVWQRLTPRDRAAVLTLARQLADR